ncbi:uncharacterized protein F4807DRAFT_419472 [Annulohypoxylon truncatum]|uniref:uncharacterized protein n=1 Tax=Annulohypoxylon truncatum TaxID=327061 RepID=UPI0020072720|nr:uncharacterized protein F4807DRAFT_419472 [Annulohypoxylon truncatum]KAI1211241.1 hypothetical protein F4807DRAFT_419472 [Annulohypoxylon truncatum]
MWKRTSCKDRSESHINLASAFSHDSMLLALALSKGAVKILAAAVILTPSQQTPNIAYSKILGGAWGSDFYIWDVSTGCPQMKLCRETQGLTQSMIYYNDPQFLAVVSDNIIETWSIETRALKQTDTRRILASTQTPESGRNQVEKGHDNDLSYDQSWITCKGYPFHWHTTTVSTKPVTVHRR